MAQESQSNVSSLDWWRSEAAAPRRCATYLAVMLASDPEYRREECGSPIMPGPAYPAFWYYEGRTDLPMWIEVKHPIHARDYFRGYPDNLNKAAMALMVKP